MLRDWTKVRIYINCSGSFDRNDTMLQSPGTRARATSSSKRSRYSSRVMGTAGVVAIIYLFGCGGPIGTGMIIYAGGPLVGLLAIALYPLVMTVPYGYIIAELCSAFPHDGGFAVWVMHAFGHFWGFQVGYWSWVSGILTCAFVPDLLVNAIEYSCGATIEAGLVTYLVKVAIAVCLTVPTLGGTIFTSRVSVVLVVAALLPFAIFTVWAYTAASTTADFTQVRREYANAAVGSSDVITTGDVDIRWDMLINTLAWKFGGLNMASLFAGEVKDPSRVFSRAISITIVLSFVTVFVPLPAAIATHQVPWSSLDEEDAFMSIAGKIGGVFLSAMVVVSAIATTIGRYIASMYCTSFELSGMAEYEMLPAFVANKSNRFRSPQLAVLCTLVPVLPLLLLEFDHLLLVGNAFACAVELLILVAAIKLRHTMPYIPRPVKMPGGMFTLVLSTLVPATVLCYILYDSLIEAHTRTIVLVALVPGLLHGLSELWKQHKAEAALDTVVIATPQQLQLQYSIVVGATSAALLGTRGAERCSHLDLA